MLNILSISVIPVAVKVNIDQFLKTFWQIESYSTTKKR